MTPSEFCLRVWAIHCQPGDYVALSSKKAGDWSDKIFAYDDDLAGNLDAWLSRNADGDLYFCPLPFSQKRRNKAYIPRAGMLWSDVDEVKDIRVRPSVLWESSPGRFQALWFLKQQVSSSEAEELNKKLTYYIGADRGGWDLTQVLRIPGTKNFKYATTPTVKLRHWEDRQYGYDIVPDALLEKYRRTLPRKLVRLLESKAEVGKRSDMIWSLEHSLREAGVPTKDVIGLIKESDWNKYRGRSDEDERFAVEMKKIREEKDEEEGEERTFDLYIESYSGLMGSVSSVPGWLCEGFWMRNSHGIVAGEPKSFKSTLALDLAFSVASGKPFLGQFRTEHGPVLYVQNENADWILRDRLEKLAKVREETGRVSRPGLKVEFARELPLFFVNQQGFSLNDAAQKRGLEEAIEHYKPVLVIFDPLYLMFEGDVNSAKDLNPVLNWLLSVRTDMNTAVMLIHHYNKGKDDGRRGGQKMLGSTTLHGWIESAWYLRVNGEEPTTADVNTASAEALVTMEREFRGAGLYPKIDIGLKLGEFGRAEYETKVGIHTAESESDYDEEITSLIARADSPLSERQISQGIGLSRYQTKKHLERLVKSGKIERDGERYKG